MLGIAKTTKSICSWKYVWTFINNVLHYYWSMQWYSSTHSVWNGGIKCRI